ncbi:MAG: hypothetical protein KAW52_00235 [candidate division Zixibacteria bacterium]|nr:hypothetical protein [candidate division Zixibacteria bacterium]
MSVESIKNLKESPEIKLNEGVDELAAVTDVGFNRALQMDNWRVSEDGERCEKRDGVTEIAGPSTFGAKDVFGYHTYYDATPAFCQLVITEDEVWRKVGAATWASIHTWASTLAHPVKVLDIQGKQIIVTEIENIMILPAGTKVQLGISAPTTAPTIAAEYLDLDLDEDCADISDWTDADAGSGASTQATFDSKSTFKFLTTGSSGDIARRRYDLAQIGADFTFETSIYFDDFGIVSDGDYFEIAIYNGRILFKFRVDAQGAYVYDGENWKAVVETRRRKRVDRRVRRRRAVEVEEDYWMEEEAEEEWEVKACPLSVKDTWKALKIAVKSSDPENETCEVFVDEKSTGEYPCGNKDTTNAGRVELAAYGDTVATIVYTDLVKLKSADIKTGNLKGTYRYAVTYARSGNYPNESNPIKAIVGSAAITGAGLDDLTPGGTYTGDEDITIRVEIDGTGTPDTIKWSEDGGQTWNTTTMPMTSTMYLPFGIELAWAATTGHTSGDYWEFTCDSLTVSPANQKVELSVIPTSSDTGQVDQRKIYRTQPGGAAFYLVQTINDNTTTTFVDNIPDALLGAPMNEDNDIAPLGKYSEWWDGKLWIADEDENLVYYSKTWVPDAFDTNRRYVSARRGISDDEITGVIDYRSVLYILKRSGITFVRKKLTGAYGVYDGPGTNGCIAPWSLLEAYGLLMYLSFRGWEVYNGEDSFSILFSKPVMNTVKSLDKTKAEYVMAARLQSKDEILLSIPDRTGSASAVTVILNKARAAFYTFSFSKVPSCLCEIRDSSKEIQLVMGTRDGYVGTTESGTQDFGTNITAAVRTGWWKFPIYQNFPMMEVEYEAPTGNTLTVNQYVNFDKDVQRTEALAGATPTSATDRSIRLPIKNRIKAAIRGKYLAFEFTNAENVGSALKLNWFKQFYAPLVRKGEVKGD